MTYPAAPYTWELDGVKWNDGSGRYLTTVNGWFGRPAPRTNKTPAVAADGVYVGGQYRDGRVIELQGAIFCSSPRERDDAIDLVQSLCSSGGAQGRYVLARTAGSRSRRSTVILDDTIELRLSRDNLTVRFDTQLFAPDSRMYSHEQRVAGPVEIRAEAPGGVLWNGEDGVTGVEWNGPASSPMNANSAFEAGIASWTGVGASIAHSNEQHYSGSYALKLTPSGTNASPRAESERIGITQGRQYRVSARLYSTVGWASGVQVNINWYDAGGAYLATSGGNTVALPAATWVEGSALAFPPANATHAQIAPMLVGTPAASVVTWLDDATLTRAGTGLQYQIGSGSSGILQAFNAGRVDTPVTLTLYADTNLVQPFVQLLSTGERVQLASTLAAGSTLVIDTATGRATINGVAVAGALSRSDFFNLRPGVNELFFSSPSANVQQGLLSAQWRDAFLGG